MCSGVTARPRAVREPEDLIPAEVIKDSLGVEQRWGCGGGSGPAPTPLLTPRGL